MSKQLKSHRKLGGFTQESLATASGISIRTIQRIEKGLSQGNPDPGSSPIYPGNDQRPRELRRNST
ncbi:MAG: helix-turn-helix transcriptional regulator [Lewinella sp.]